MIDAILYVLGNADLLSHILHYATSHTKDVAATSATCRHWNHVLNVNPKTSHSIWRNLCAVQEPDILRIYDLCQESKTCTHIGGGGWKVLLRRARTSSFEIEGANKRLQRSFELVFKEEGVIGFAIHAGRGPAGTYDTCCDFTLRERGITCFDFFLSGPNYEPYQKVCNAWVCYSGLDYLLENWENECKIIRRWCAVLGVTDYTVEKPVSQFRCINILFKNPVVFEEDDYDDIDFFDMDDDDDCDGSDHDDVDEHEE